MSIFDSPVFNQLNYYYASSHLNHGPLQQNATKKPSLPIHLILTEVFKILKLFVKCFEVGNEILVGALVYTDRILNYKGLLMTEKNYKGLLIAGLTLATKFYMDRYERNTMFHIMLGNQTFDQHSHHGKILNPKKRMRMMLGLYLDILEFKLNVNEEEY